MKQQTDYRTYTTSSYPIDKRLSSLSLSTKQETPEYAINRFSQKYDSYQEFLYRNNRRRLSSTGEGSGDSSTTTSGSSEREDGSEGRAESDETEEREDRKPLEGQITDYERQQVETFFKGLKTQVLMCGSASYQ